jgi:aspartate/methionine/tyrosine aminotransferase
MIETAERMDGVGTYYFAEKLAQIRQMNADGLDVINLGIGSPDLPPPQAVLDRLTEVLSQPDISQYQAYRSLPALREAFATWYAAHFGVKSLNTETEILPLIGSKEGIMHISMAFLNRGDQVLVPDPGYPAYSAATKLAGGQPVNYHLLEENHYQPDFDALEAMDLSRVKIMWISYPHMPTGAKAKRETFRRLIDFAKRHKILLCHDNPYAFILNEEPMSILETEGAMDVSLELTSLSKCYNMAGWRVGSVVGKKDYIDAVLKFKSNMDSGMFKGIQEAAIVALRHGQDWFDKINAVYSERRKYARQIMEALHCTYQEESVGMFLWARIPETEESAEKLSETILQRARVFITPGMVFGKNGERYLRISLCSDVETLKEANKRIKESVVQN